MIKKIVIWISTLSLSFASFANPTVKFLTPSLGFSNNAPFSLNIHFSDPVDGFSPSNITVTNAVVTGFNGIGANYTAQILPLINNGLMKVSIPANSASSTIDNTPNSASKVLSIRALSPLLHPSSNFDLSRFELITPLPIGGIGEAERIESYQLNGSPSANTGYSNPPYFYTDPVTGSMNFFAPLNGATTPNSTFPRSELSEEENLQWSISTFTNNSLTASLLIKQVPPSGTLTIGQIHDRGDTDPYGTSAPNEPLIKLMYGTKPIINKQNCGGCIHAQIRNTPVTPSNKQMDIVIATDVSLNSIFSYVIDLKNDGTLTIKANNQTQTIKLSTSNNNTIGWGSQYFLFHAGAYLHENGTSPTEGGQANFYYLNLKHS